MPKSKPKSKPKTRVRRARPRRPVAALTPYQSLLADPCTSVPLSPYGGERGIIERFVVDFSVGVASATAGVAFVSPNYNVFGSISTLTSATSANFTTAPCFAPTFVSGTVRKMRPIACCLELIPASLSITNITGELGMAVFDSSTLFGGLSSTADAVFALTNDREVIQKKDYEIKWYPGTADHLYNTTAGGTGGVLNAAEPASQNQVVIAWRGVPGGTSLSFRATCVYEWTPIAGVGMAATSAPGRPLNWEAQSAALHEAHPNWWTGKPAKMSFAQSYKRAADSNSVSRNLYAGLTDFPHLFAQVGKVLEHSLI